MAPPTPQATGAGVMGGIHGVDVSWIHFPHGRSESRNRSNSSPSPAIPITSQQNENQPAPHTHLAAPLPAASPSSTHGTPISSVPPPTQSRRGSWLSNLSSKFSSSSLNENAPLPPPPESPKFQQPGFLISTLRKLSSPGQGRGFGRGSPAPGNGGRCERVVLNRDMNRERCRISELDAGKLRKVAFCVDVEVAPLNDDVEARRAEKRRRRELKEKERAEKEKQLKEGTNVVVSDSKDGEQEKKVPGQKESASVAPNAVVPPHVVVPDIPLLDREKDSPIENPGKPEQTPTHAQEGPSAVPHTRKIHAKPTTDPTRIYTQCCQLRETSLLQRVTDQLSFGNGATVVQRLDLSGHEFILPDAVALADFLALVPVKILSMENCGLTDEMVRVVLSGLSAVKTPKASNSSKSRKDKENAARTSTETATNSNKEKERKFRGVVERLSLRNNPKIGKDGWRYICVFIHMSHSLKAIDISMIPIPRPPTVYAPPPRIPSAQGQQPSDITSVLGRAIGDRLVGTGLEELAMGNCGLGAEQITTIINGVIRSGTKKIGLAGNGLTDDGLMAVGRWIKGFYGGTCEGLDLSNNDIQYDIDILSASIVEGAPLTALCLHNCNLTPASLISLLPALAQLPNFRLLDLSNNPLLFSTQPDALPLLRRYLPKLPMLKKLQLANTSMTPDHAIALSEILPDIPMLAHFDITGNPLLVPKGAVRSDGTTGISTTEGSLEEGAALFTALMSAVKVSKTIVRVDIDEPGPGSGEVIKSLARQVLAFCIRNMEAGAVDDWTVDAPVTWARREVNQEDDVEEEGVWREENYVVGGTGVVKALGVCLGNKPTGRNSIVMPPLCRIDTEEFMGLGLGAEEEGKAGEMSRSLLGRARKIKEMIQPALRRAASGEIEELQHRRLLFLDETLHRVILRFEEEYPETRLPPTPPAIIPSLPADNISNISDPDHDHEHDPEHENDHDNDPPSPHILPLSRKASIASIATKNLEQEEGQMHRLGHYIKSSYLKDPNSDDDEGDSEVSGEDLVRMRKAVEEMGGEEIRNSIRERGGVERVIERMEGGGIVNVEEGVIGKLELEE
ncbi:Microtubules assembly and stabilization protein [Rhizina undulata]